eukprot:Tamp_02158.p1 GENE.Tamp_02158~~Tamp_02158.p1  ORF type:complete len:810 (-),score=229.93 Tamp_02158:2149-4578(-)
MAAEAPELATDPKVKKGVKDLALPIKPAATKSCLGFADGIRKAASEAAKQEARRQMGLRVEEKGKAWDGGVVPMIVACALQAKEKPMAEAVSLCMALMLADSPQNVGLAEAAKVEKVAVDLCKDKSLLVQSHAAMAIAAVATAGTAENRTKLVAAGAVKQLTAIASAADSEKALADQGVNKLIPYRAGQRQEEAASALYTVTVDDQAKQSAMEVGTLKTLISMIANQEIIKIVTKKETTELPAVSVRAKVEAAGALLRCVTEPANRAHVCELGGVAPVIKLLSHEDIQARERAAGVLHQMSMEQALRVPIVEAGGVGALLALCDMKDCSTLAHEEAAGALLYLANEEAAKCELCRLNAAKTLSTLLGNVKTNTDDGERVAENTLACVAHMCVHNNNSLRNAKRTIISLNHTGNARLQDSCSPSANKDLVPHVVRHCSDDKSVVSGQAVAALAALCCEHAVNAREAGRCKGPKVAMSLLLSVTDDDARIANLILALLSMAESCPDNVRVMLRMGASQRLLMLNRGSAHAQVRAFAARLLDALGCVPSINHQGAGELVSSLRIGQPYEKQAAAPKEGINVTIARLRACRARLTTLLAERPGISAALIEVALRDCTNFDGGKEGGANGCIRLGDRRKAAIDAGLQGAMALIDEMHGDFADIISWTDLLYMAASQALERRGVENLLMVYGRQDGKDGAPVAEGLLPQFSGPTHEPQREPTPVPEGEGEEPPAEGEEEGESKKPPPPPPKVQLVERLTRLGLTPAQQVALVGFYLSLHSKEAKGTAPVNNALLTPPAPGSRPLPSHTYTRERTL